MYTVELLQVNAEVVAFDTTKSQDAIPVTDSENVAVTVNGAFVLAEAGVVSATVGITVSIVNEFTARTLLAFVAMSVTVIVQAAYVPSTNVLKEIVFAQTTAAVVELTHPPLYDIVPTSSEVNV